MKAKTFRAVCFSCVALILAIVTALNVAVYLFRDTLDRFVIGYKSEAAGENAARESGEALAKQIQYEGSVLVKNDGVLPFEKSEVAKVNVFGWASVDWVYSGSGSGRVEGTRDRSDAAKTQLYDLYDALEAYGIEYNPSLSAMYRKYKERRDHADPFSEVSVVEAGALGTLHSFNYEFSMLYEPSVEDRSYYSEALLSEAEAYSETALVVIGRISGESNDSPKVQYKYKAETDPGRTYLEISTEEEALLRYVGGHYKNVVVLINSTSVMELGFLDTVEGLDSCLIVGTTGTAGALSIPPMLYGELAPSGRTADTYAYDLSTNPTYVNTGSGIKGANGKGEDTNNFYTNGAGLYPTTVQHTNGSSKVSYSGVAYTDYAESIYVGYKWYETADAEHFWESDRAKAQWGIQNGYRDVVQFPFGFGLDYTQFEWKLESFSPTENSSITEADEISIRVKVTNIGTKYSGQDVVQLYYEPPYTSDGVEKSAVNLVAFAKTTKVLAPGESQVVELKISAEDMKSYDVSGEGGYVLDEGKYTLTLRTDAHTPANERFGNADDAFITYHVDSRIRLDRDDTTGNPVKNRFTGKNTTDGVAIDGNSDGTAKITYLSRSDFSGTFPYVQAENRAMADAIRALNIYTAEMADAWIDPTAPAVTTGASPEILLYDTSKIKDENGNYVDVGVSEFGLLLGDPDNYYSDIWDPVLDQLTEKEMQDTVLHAYIGTSAIGSVGKPVTADVDGPNQIGSFDNKVNGGTGFSAILLGQSWNPELAYSMGLTVGTEAAAKTINGWYGPGVNIHRSPFCGRNYEYYSEDALISGSMSANAVEAARNAGVFSYLKHICLYESESNRDGMYNWVTEQALREIYIRPFEICVKKGGATGIMTSYGRIGAVWTGGSTALLTEVVRGEWGFKGAFLTDYADNQKYMNGDQMVRAGGDLWMDGVGINGKFNCETSSNSFKQALRRANKNVIYMWLNALKTNKDYNDKIERGEIDGVQIITSSPELNFRWYIPALIAVDVVAVGGCATWVVFAIRKKDRKEKKK